MLHLMMLSILFPVTTLMTWMILVIFIMALLC